MITEQQLNQILNQKGDTIEFSDEGGKSEELSSSKSLINGHKNKSEKTLHTFLVSLFGDMNVVCR